MPFQKKSPDLLTWLKEEGEFSWTKTMSISDPSCGQRKSLTNDSMKIGKNTSSNGKVSQSKLTAPTVFPLYIQQSDNNLWHVSSK